MPLVSVVIATYNAKDNLQRAIDSVRGQKSPGAEILVADGGSTDGTVQIVRKNTKFLSWWTSAPDGGIYEAWNKAVKHASGKWVLFLGADDELASGDVISKFYELDKAIPDHVTIAYGHVAQTDRAGNTWATAGTPWNSFKAAFRERGQMLPHQAVFHRRILFDSDLCFDEKFKIAGDYEFLLRVLKDRDPHYLGEFLVSRMELGGVSSGFNNMKMHAEFMRARAVNGYPETAWTVALRSKYWMRSALMAAIGVRGAMKANNWVRRIQGKPQLPEESSGR